MPITVRFDPSVNSVQAQIIQDATPTSDGVMSAAQAAKLARLTPGIGTVTSVGLSASPSGIFSVGDSPVTGAGTLALGLQEQSQGLVLAGPVAGGEAVPSFRRLTSTDLPSSGGAGLFFSTAALAADVFFGKPTTGGNYTNGAMFATDRTILVQGARWWQPNAVLPVTLFLWKYDGTWQSVASATITPTASTLTTLTFDVAQELGPTSPYVIGVYDGTNQLLFNSVGGTNFGSFTQPGQPWTNGSNSAAAAWGYGLWLYGFGYTANNTPGILTLNQPNYTGIDLLYSF